MAKSGDWDELLLTAACDPEQTFAIFHKTRNPYMEFDILSLPQN
jgi:hypothetical protein